MEEPFALIDRLRRAACLATRMEEGKRGTGDALTRGLAPAQLHEIHALSQGEAASGAGFAIGCVLAAGARPILWLRTEAAERQGGRLHGPGLIAMGLDPADLVVVVVGDDSALLRAAADGARCPGLGTVIAEGWGAMRGLDLTASRRLMLAAEASDLDLARRLLAARRRCSCSGSGRRPRRPIAPPSRRTPGTSAVSSVSPRSTCSARATPTRRSL